MGQSSVDQVLSDKFHVIPQVYPGLCVSSMLNFVVSTGFMFVFLILFLAFHDILRTVTEMRIPCVRSLSAKSHKDFLIKVFVK
jgi:hypothetical protein